MLDALRFHRYRAFDAWTELELRPLTVIFGYNNAGKSAILRLLPGLAESIKAEADPLYLRGAAFREAPFVEVSHHGSRSLSFGLSWGDGRIAEAEWALRGDDVTGQHWVDGLKLSCRDGSRLELAWIDRGDGAERYRISTDAGEVEADIPFRGPVPSVVHGSGQATSALDALRAQLEPLPERVRWITSHRGEVGRKRQLATPPPRKVLFDAGDAADVLSTAHSRRMREGDALLDAVNALYRELGEPDGHGGVMGHALAVTPPSDGQYSLHVSRPGAATGYAPNLVDTGEGMTQVLPIAVALAQIASASPRRPELLCIEQPELHLHPRAQQAVADHLVRSVMKHDARLLVETHAHHVMLAIQVALAEGRLDPENVVVYWARQSPHGGSRLERVALDDKGRDAAGAWPPDVFNDDARMARRLIRARRIEP